MLDQGLAEAVVVERRVVPGGPEGPAQVRREARDWLLANARLGATVNLPGSTVAAMCSKSAS